MVLKGSIGSKEMIVLGELNANFLTPGNSKDLKSIKLFALKQIIAKLTINNGVNKGTNWCCFNKCTCRNCDTGVIATSICDYHVPGRVRKVSNDRE